MEYEGRTKRCRVFIVKNIGTYGFFFRLVAKKKSACAQD